MSMSRFWFHVADSSPKFQRRTGVVAIDRCAVVVLTERQEATASGKLVDAAGDACEAIAFADEMSEYLAHGRASEVPVYADLENLYRLRALLLAMDSQGAMAHVGWSFGSFIPSYTYQDERAMPPSIPGLTNHKEGTVESPKGKHVLLPMVCGGVGMDMRVQVSDFRDDLGSELSEFRVAALMARKPNDALAWTIGER